MGRIRTIKPEFFINEDLYDLEKKWKVPVRLGYAGLWTIADREGRFEWKPRQLKAAILPHDTVNFDKVLDALEKSGRVKRYAVDGREFGWIRSWERHQVINFKERQSVLPTPPSEVTIPCAPNTHEERESDASATRQARVSEGREGKGREDRKASGTVARERNTNPSEAEGHSPAPARGETAQAVDMLCSVSSLPQTRTVTSPPSAPPMGGNGASSSNAKRMAEHIVQALEMTDSSLEGVNDGCARAIDLYPEKSEMELCNLLIEMRRRYEKFASDESKHAQSAEFFFASGLWYQPDYWCRYLGSKTESQAHETQLELQLAQIGALSEL